MNEGAEMTEDRSYRVGDKVTPDPEAAGVPPQTLGRVYTVAKVNPKNLRCTADGGGRGINFPAYLLLPATDENVAQAQSPRVQPEVFELGAIVTLKRDSKEWDSEQPMVVVGGRIDKVNVAPLGGDGDRYLRVAPQGLMRRDASWLAEALLDKATC